MTKSLSGQSLPAPGQISILEVAEHSVTVDVINMKVIAELDGKGCINESLLDSEELPRFAQFSTASYPFVMVLIKAKVYHHVVKALQRQLKLGPTMETAEALNAGSVILTYVLHHMPSAKTEPSQIYYQRRAPRLCLHQFIRKYRSDGRRRCSAAHQREVGDR